MHDVWAIRGNALGPLGQARTELRSTLATD